MTRKTRTLSNSAVVNRLDATLGCDARRAHLPEIVSKVRKLSLDARVRMCSELVLAIGETYSVADELNRVAIVKTPVSLSPESEPVLRKWLSPDIQGKRCEVQFTLFCFLHELCNIEEGRKFARDVPSLVGHYLANVRTDAARAAWMGGDLLGDHWPLREALPVLETCALTGRFAIGRGAALHGLGQALNRSDVETEGRIRACLAKIANTDRSALLRSVAEQILRVNKGEDAASVFDS